MPEGPTPVTRLAQLRRMTGTWFFVVAFVARIPVAMDVVGVLTLVSVERGLATAGLVSAALGIASGFGGPVVGALADRVGQRPVLIVVAVLHTGLLLGLLAVVYSGASVAVLLVLAVLAGASIPPASPLARARWLALLAPDTRAGGRGVPVALGYETMADEISFVGGPILVGLLATAFGPAAPLLVAAVITLGFVSAFALHPTAVVARPGAHEGAPDVAPLRELLRPGVVLATGGMLAIGGFFGSTLASATAVMETIDAGEATGLLYGVMGATSAAAAITVGRLPARFPLRLRWLVFAAGMTAVALVLPHVPTLAGVAVCFTIVGGAVGAAVVTIFTIGADAAPAGRLATTMALVSSGIIIGQGIAVAVVGGLADAAGAVAALSTVAVPAGLGLVLAAVHLVLVRPRRRPSAGTAAG
ncbi:MAG: MFS transporter [Protaetiibacter sp.]